MCKHLKEAAGQDIAVPGHSQHEKGKAIDTQVNSTDSRVRALLWCHVEFEKQQYATKIITERNSCVHFEFV